MIKQTLKVATKFGEFTRTTHTAYTHIVVRSSNRAVEAITLGHKGGVYGKWVKDNGFAVTWHSSKQAADKAASKPYIWDNETKVIGIYAV